MRTILYKVNGYKPAVLDNGVKASPCSFRLDLRNFCKQRKGEDGKLEWNKKYFQPVSSNAKNLGCHLFGQKDTWKGVLGIYCEENNDIIIWIEKFRNTEDIDKIRDLVEEALEEMVKEHIITGYKAIKEEK